jgi:hypothetical protein
VQCGGLRFFAYAVNYLIDVKFGIIMVKATRAIRQAEVGAARTMIERVVPKALPARRSASGRSPSDWRPIRLTAPPRRSSGLVNEKQIAPHIPVWDRSKREDGTFSREDFTSTRRATSIRARGQGAHHHRQNRECRAAPVQGEQVRLRCVPLQDAMLPEGASVQDPAQRL